jgi:hypothetical protein
VDVYSEYNLLLRSVAMPDKSEWKIDLLEDSMVIVVLIGLGAAVVMIKLLPPILRWARRP